MKQMEIKTNTSDLLAIIGVAGAYVYDVDTEEIKKMREVLTDDEFMLIVAEISCKVIDHLTGEEPLDEETLMVARYITRMHDNQ